MRHTISTTRRERGSEVLETLRQMAISYQLNPGEHVSEVELAQRLGVSRTPVETLVELDEGFHLRLAEMAGNAELERILSELNERIRFIRWIDMQSLGRESTQNQHAAILRVLRTRNPKAGAAALRGHIGRRRDQIVEAIKRGLARIYLPHEAGRGRQRRLPLTPCATRVRSRRLCLRHTV